MNNFPGQSGAVRCCTPYFLQQRVQRLSLLLLTLAAGCTTCDVAILTRGNLDRVADVVVVNLVDGNSIAITSNPELEHLRVLDLTLGQFTAAPNRFSPLSIATGPDTRRLSIAVDAKTTISDPTRLYALDGSDDTVRIIRLDKDADGTAFVEVGTLPTGRGPAALAALRQGAATLVAIALPDSAVIEVTTLIRDEVVGFSAIVLPAGSHPTSIVTDPQGRSFVVGDAVLPALHVLAVAEDGAVVLDRSLDVLGPVQHLAAGIVDVGDGLASVVVALRSDTPAVMAVRLFRPGFREDRYAVLGGAALPSLGQVAYVPDARPDAAQPTVVGKGLAAAALAAGEATAAFAAVWMSNGDLLYVQIAAAAIDGVALPPGRRLVRLVDDDLEGLSAPEGIDLNTTVELWVPTAGGENRRPVLALTSVDNFGAVPFVPLTAAGTSLLLVWEGDLTTARRLRGSFALASASFQTSVNPQGRGVRVGDVARFEKADAELGCEPSFRARIIAVDAEALTLATDGAEPFLSTAQMDCLDPDTGDTRLTVEVQGAFVVEDGGRLVGRLSPAGNPGGQDVVALAGVNLSFATSSAGLPVAGSRLAVPLDAHVVTLGLNLATSPRVTGGGFGSAAFVPTAIAGGTLNIPDASSAVAGAAIPARRMVLSSGSVDGTSGLPLIFTCDEGETITDRIETFR